MRKPYLQISRAELNIFIHLAPPWNVMSRWPISKEQPDALMVGWPLPSTPATTLTDNDTLLTDTSQLPSSEMWGLYIIVCEIQKFEASKQTFIFHD